MVTLRISAWATKGSEDTIDKSLFYKTRRYFCATTPFMRIRQPTAAVLVREKLYRDVKFGWLTSYPPERGRITGYEEHGENWLSDLWDGKIINWWNSAGNVGAFLVLKLTYTNSQVSGSVPVQVRQHIGTKTTLLNGGELFETPTNINLAIGFQMNLQHTEQENPIPLLPISLDASWELVIYNRVRARRGPRSKRPIHFLYLFNP